MSSYLRALKGTYDFITKNESAQGGMFGKFSQVLSQSAEVKDGCDEYSTIYSDNKLESVELNDLFIKINKIAHIKKEPIGVGTIAAVFELVDESDCVVKIWVPRFIKLLEEDCRNLSKISDFVSLFKSDLSVAMNDINELFANECVPELEWKMYKKLYRAWKHNESIIVPRPVRFVNKEMIFMKKLKGKKLMEIETLENRLLAASLLVKFYFDSAQKYDLMQTDMNPGNFLFDEETRTLGCMDFGAVVKSPKKMSEILVNLRISLMNEEKDQVIEKHMMLLGVISTDMNSSDKKQVINWMTQTLLPFYKRGLQKFDQQYIKNFPMFNVAALKTKIPKYLMLFSRSSYQVLLTLCQLNVELDVYSIIN